MARPFKGVTFWDRVYSRVRETGDCLEFTGCKDSCGYGRINRDGKLVRIHRAVWERDNGKIPCGMVVMHKCDNPACIRPEHLMVGTQMENVADMWKKGRAENLRLWGNAHTKGKSINRGSAHGAARLTESQVREIKAQLALNAAGIMQLAKQYGVSRTAIYHIKRGDRWRHVG